MYINNSSGRLGARGATIREGLEGALADISDPDNPSTVRQDLQESVVVADPKYGSAYQEVRNKGDEVLRRIR